MFESWFKLSLEKGQGRIRGRFGPQNISSQFFDDPMQKNVVILLVINLGKIVRTASHFEVEYLQKSIGFSFNTKRKAKVEDFYYTFLCI